MFRSYIKILIRNLIWHRGYTIINILGLATGVASCLMVIIYLKRELSFDRFNLNYRNIYRIVSDRKTPGGIVTDVVTPPPLVPALKEEFPQISESTRLLTIDNPVPLITIGQKKFYEKKFLFADSGLFRIFTIPFIYGNPEKALNEPYSVVITEEIARKYFGPGNPVGSVIRLNNQLLFRVTGVIKSFPDNSSLNGNLLASFTTLYNWLGKDFMNDWKNNMCQAWILLGTGSHAGSLTDRFSGFLDKYVEKSMVLKQLHLQPLTRVHLFSFKDFRIQSNGDINAVYILSAVALFILLIAFFNYAGISAAQANSRLNEARIRKAFGAENKQLFFQLLSESGIIVFTALLVALTLIIFLMPALERFTEGILSPWIPGNWISIFLFSVISLITGIASNCYSASYISNAKTGCSINDDSMHVLKKTVFRKMIIIIQFTLTIFLILGSWIINDQLSYMQRKKLGVDADQIIVIPIRDETLRQDQSAIRTRLLQEPGIQEISAASLFPGGPVGKSGFQVEGSHEKGSIAMMWVDYEFIRTLGIKIIAGRDFQRSFITDSVKGFIINKTASRQLGFTNPDEAIGKSFELIGSKKGQIIGVTEDFHYTSFQKKIEPLVLHIWPWMNYLLIHIQKNNIASIIPRLQKIWNEFDAVYPFEYSLMIDNFNKFYLPARRLEKLCSLFTLVALLIACFGLFSFSSYMMESRTKEICIRKLNGATVSELLYRYNSGFIFMVMLSFILAVPCSMFIMNKWLQNFAYRTTIRFGIILMTGTAVFLIAFVTVSWQTWKASSRNPVESLRYE